MTIFATLWLTILATPRVTIFATPWLTIFATPRVTIFATPRVTVLVENVEDGREYTVEEIHNSESEISQISVQDPLRYI